MWRAHTLMPVDEYLQVQLAIRIGEPVTDDDMFRDAREHSLIEYDESVVAVRNTKRRVKAVRGASGSIEKSAQMRNVDAPESDDDAEEDDSAEEEDDDNDPDSMNSNDDKNTADDISPVSFLMTGARFQAEWERFQASDTPRAIKICVHGATQVGKSTIGQRIVADLQLPHPLGLPSGEATSMTADIRLYTAAPFAAGDGALVRVDLIDNEGALGVARPKQHATAERARSALRFRLPRRRRAAADDSRQLSRIRSFFRRRGSKIGAPPVVLQPTQPSVALSPATAVAVAPELQKRGSSVVLDEAALANRALYVDKVYPRLGYVMFDVIVFVFARSSAEVQTWAGELAKFAMASNERVLNVASKPALLIVFNKSQAKLCESLTSAGAADDALCQALQDDAMCAMRECKVFEFFDEQLVRVVHVPLLGDRQLGHARLFVRQLRAVNAAARELGASVRMRRVAARLLASERDWLYGLGLIAERLGVNAFASIDMYDVAIALLDDGPSSRLDGMRALVEWSRYALDDVNADRVTWVRAQLCDVLVLWRLRNSGSDGVVGELPPLVVEMCRDACSQLFGSLRCEATHGGIIRNGVLSVRCQNRATHELHGDSHRGVSESGSGLMHWLKSTFTPTVWAGASKVDPLLRDRLKPADVIAESHTVAKWARADAAHMRSFQSQRIARLRAVLAKSMECLNASGGSGGTGASHGVATAFERQHLRLFGVDELCAGCLLNKCDTVFTCEHAICEKCAREARMYVSNRCVLCNQGSLVPFFELVNKHFTNAT